MRKLLAVMPEYTTYHPRYAVTVAHSFAQAKELLLQAELAGVPFDDLDLPVSDENAFWVFLEWMRGTGQNYPFSIFGCDDTDRFWSLVQKARAQGFYVNT